MKGKREEDRFLVPQAALCSRIQPWHETSLMLPWLRPSSSEHPAAPSRPESLETVLQNQIAVVDSVILEELLCVRARAHMGQVEG